MVPSPFFFQFPTFYLLLFCFFSLLLFIFHLPLCLCVISYYYIIYTFSTSDVFPVNCICYYCNFPQFCPCVLMTLTLVKDLLMHLLPSTVIMNLSFTRRSGLCWSSLSSFRFIIDIYDLCGTIVLTIFKSKAGFQLRLQSLYSSSCWCSVIQRFIGCNTALPIVHFYCTPHKEQIYPLGTFIQSHTHISSHNFSSFRMHNQLQLNTQMHTVHSNSLSLSLCLLLSHSHTGTL